MGRSPNENLDDRDDGHSSRCHSKGEKSMLSVNIDNSVNLQPPPTPETTMVTNTAVYVVKEPSKECNEEPQQEEVPNPKPVSPEEEARAREIERTKRWFVSL